MGIAAYNRGSKAISNQIDIQLHGRVMDYRKPAPKQFVSELPEGVLRTGYMPDDFLAGTMVELIYENGWYIVRTRWQNLKRRRDLKVAARIFENVQLYGAAALENR